MGGTLAWDAMDLMVEMFGIDDIEGWIRAMAQIRDHQSKKRDDDQPR